MEIKDNITSTTNLPRVEYKGCEYVVLRYERYLKMFDIKGINTYRYDAVLADNDGNIIYADWYNLNYL